jgi:hypothetical protein
MPSARASTLRAPFNRNVLCYELIVGRPRIYVLFTKSCNSQLLCTRPVRAPKVTESDISTNASRHTDSMRQRTPLQKENGRYECCLATRKSSDNNHLVEFTADSRNTLESKAEEWVSG